MPKVMVCGPFSIGMERPGMSGPFNQALRDKILHTHRVLRDAGFEVVSAHLADNFAETEWQDSFCERDLDWAGSCDAQLVLLPEGADGACMRTDGTMIELGYAHGRNRPTIILAESLNNDGNSLFLKAFATRIASACVEWRQGFEPALVAALNKATSNSALIKSDPKKAIREHRSDVDAMLDQLQRDANVHTVEVGDLHLTVLPEVLSPRFSHAPDALMSKWIIPTGARVLDLGCGCGVLGLNALAKGASHLVALDINPRAVENTNLNLTNLGWLARGEARLSDAYSALKEPERFDVILFAAPYWNRSAANDLERSCFDKDYTFFSKAVSGAHKWLANNGTLYIVFSDQGDLGVAMRAIEGSGLQVSQMHIFRPTQPAGHVRIIWELRRLPNSEGSGLGTSRGQKRDLVATQSTAR